MAAEVVVVEAVEAPLDILVGERFSSPKPA